MKEKETMEALRRFNKACDEMLTAQILLGCKTRVDFNGVYIEVYNARKLTREWLKKLESENENV